MPLSRVTKWYGVKDAALWKLTADPAGGSATYGTLIDVPGIKEVGVTTTIETKELRGDNKRLDQDSTLVGVGLSFSHAKMSLDALAVIVGGTNTDSGTTPNQKVQFRRLGADTLNHFKFEAQSVKADTVGGDGHMVFYKCILSGNYEIGFAEEDYRIFSGSAECTPRIADDFWFDILLNETAVAIA